MQEPSLLRERVDAACRAILKGARLKPRFGITLGTGLGGIVREMEVESRIPYVEIPGFPHPRVATHTGSLVLGRLAGQPVVALEGRYHLYEGYSLEEITLPVRVLKGLGVELAVFSNASGGLNPLLKLGDIVIVDDHINLMGVNPLVGPNDDVLGPRFPDMSDPYSRTVNNLLEDIATEEGIRARRGVYAAMTGPSLETRAEYRMLRLLGADIIGMSTVPEVIVAVHAGLKSVALSCVTDLCLPDALKPVNIEEIIRVAGESEPRLARLVSRLVQRYAEV